MEKAEKEAIKGEYFGLLHLIYDHIIELSLQNHHINAEKYVKKRKANDEKYQVSQQLNSVLAIINNRLFASNFSGKDESIVEQLKKIIKKWEFTECYQNSVKIQFQIHSCVRDTLLQKKDFEVLENYLIESLANFEQKKLFNKANFQRKIVILSWIINTLTKNKKFEMALQYAESLHQSLLAFDSLFYDKYICIYYQSQIINYSFLNKNKQVVDLLLKLKNNEKLQKQSFYHLFVYLNLATTYYSMKQLENALENLNEIVNTDIYNSLSINWKVNLLIVEIIFLLEKEEFNFAFYKINSLKRNLRKELKKEAYNREKQFISILQSIAQIPAAFRDTKTLKKINDFIEKSPPFELGSNEAINYCIWLQSKLKRRDYYELILELVKV